jgi:hypothetical protein
VITTDELIQRLSQRGLSATSTILDNDVHDGFLPGRPWEDWVLARATRLYRLRSFGNQIGVRQTVRNPTPKSLEFSAAEAAERMRQNLLKRTGKPEDDPMQIRETTMAFIWGQGLFGESLPQGSLRTFAPIFHFFFPEATEDEVRAGVTFFEETLKFTGLTWKNFEELIEFADDDVATEALRGLWWTVRMLRHGVHDAARAERRPEQSTNPLTLFGHWAQSGEFWKKLPERITPAQMLGGLIATCVIATCLPLVILAKLIDLLLAPGASTSN